MKAEGLQKPCRKGLGANSYAPIDTLGREFGWRVNDSRKKKIHIICPGSKPRPSDYKPTLLSIQPRGTKRGVSLTLLSGSLHSLRTHPGRDDSSQTHMHTH